MGKLDKTIGDRLKLAREGAGLSQQDVADLIGMSQTNYGDFERAKRSVAVEYLIQLSRILGRPVEWFLGLDTGLADDEGQLLALYRSIGDPAAKEQALDLMKTVAKRWQK